MRVLVTGVTGALGGKVARRLTDAGHVVRGLSRDPGRWSERPDGAEAVEGDLCEPGRVIAAAEGCEAILHLALRRRAERGDRRAIDRVNVQGFGHVVEAARASGARLFHVNSIVALGPTGGEAHDASSPRTTMEFQGDQERTLWVADQMARHVAGDGRPLVRLYAGFLFGPGTDPERNGVARTLCDHARGRSTPLSRGPAPRRCLALLDDVADGVQRALERARDGSGYVLGGENRGVDELLAAFAAATGVAPPRRRRIGGGKLAARLRRWGSVAAGARPAPDAEELARRDLAWVYDSAPAQRELGYRVTPFDEAVAATAAWLRETGHL